LAAVGGLTTAVTGRGAGLTSLVTGLAAACSRCPGHQGSQQGEEVYHRQACVHMRSGLGGAWRPLIVRGPPTLTVMKRHTILA